MKNWSRRHLPSLNSFATFEVAAKHLSFTNAASELNVTQAAVSQQVKYLERALGKPLFLRQHKALELTLEGRQLLGAISSGLDSISQAVAEVQGSAESLTITCSATVAVATHWLKPITDLYAKSNPSIRFSILASDEDDTLRNFKEVDVAFVCGNERFGVGENVHYLFPEVVKPVCSPGFARDNNLNSIEEIAQSNLLHLHQKHWNSAAIGWQPINWPDWFAKSNYFRELPAPGFVSNNYCMLIDAAIRGEGVVLGWQHIVHTSLVNNDLCVANDTALRLERGNYIKVSNSGKSGRHAADFADFILDFHKDWDVWD
ncbi:LysR family transcriptional regulator [Ruegeria sp.]|uniref:LysR family transcriptional regulator n=1 Tax=Ruegeria sp. TaxID=1879320 RepID=UPI003B595479